MKIFVATFTDGSGYGMQKVFKNKNDASTWLRKVYNKSFDEDDTSFREHCEYGAWTGKIKSFKIGE